MNEEKNDNTKEKVITIEDIPKINPNTISKMETKNISLN